MQIVGPTCLFSPTRRGLGVLAIAKTIHRLRGSLLVEQRLFDPA